MLSTYLFFFHHFQALGGIFDGHADVCLVENYLLIQKPPNEREAEMFKDQEVKDTIVVEKLDGISQPLRFHTSKIGVANYNGYVDLVPIHTYQI